MTDSERDVAEQVALTINEVVARGEGRWILHCDRRTVSLDREDFDLGVPASMVPQSGDTLLILGPGRALFVDGVYLNGRRLYHHDAEQRRACAERRHLRVLKLQMDVRERDEAIRDAGVRAFPAPLRTRVLRLRARGFWLPREAWDRQFRMCVVADHVAVRLRERHGWSVDEIVPVERAMTAFEAFMTQRQKEIGEHDAPLVALAGWALALRLLVGWPV